MLVVGNTYKRKGNIILEKQGEDWEPILELLQNFIDIEILSEEHIWYMNAYIRNNPLLVEVIF